MGNIPSILAVLANSSETGSFTGECGDRRDVHQFFLLPIGAKKTGVRPVCPQVLSSVCPQVLSASP